MGDANGVAKDRGLRIPVIIDIHSPDKLDQLARLGSKMRPLGIDRLPDQV